MKFRFYITDMYDGDIKGTNNADLAYELSECEDYFVVDTEAQKWLQSGNNSCDIKEFKQGENQ